MAARVVLLRFALSLSLSLALPSPFFRTFFLNLTVPTCACTQESERAGERRKIVKINELFFPWPSDRPTDRLPARRPLSRLVPSWLPAVGWTVKEGRMERAVRGREGGGRPSSLSAAAARVR